jgi:serine/threonine protein kinase
VTTSRGQHLVGKVLGSCTLERLLGYGGSSAVFLAEQRSPQRKVAVKVFLPRPNMNAQMQKSFYTRFLHEAEAASKLDHPHILAVYSYGEQDGLPYIVMPYMAGGTLTEYVLEHGPLSLNEAQHHLQQIAAALDYAHEQGYVHCDVKPANILLDGEGNVVLSDFGIAHLMQPDLASPQQAVKSSETLMGTPDYISPEQALGQPLDGRSDIYSLGVTLYFLLAGEPPFKADDSIAMALLHVHETPPALGLTRADITPFIDRVIGKALAKWPEDRYQTAGAFYSAFAKAVAAAANVGHAKRTGLRGKNVEKTLEDADSGEWDVIEGAPASVFVKPLQPRSSRFSPKVLSALLLLIVILGTVAATFTLLKHHPDGRAAAPTPAVAIKSNRTLPDNLLDDTSEWPSTGAFFFVNGQYHIQNYSQKYVALALYRGTTFTNFQLTVTATEVHGPHDLGAYYGVVFRSTGDQSHYYLFEFVAAGGGEYEFRRYDAGQWKILTLGSLNSSLHNGKQNNVITIVAKGNTFTFSINNVSVSSSPITLPTQSILTSGYIGLYVEESKTEVAFSNLDIKPL